MYLINGEYFKGGLLVPNAYDLNSDLDFYVNKYARVLLRYALGFKLFDDLDSYIVNGVLDTNAPQKWKNLIYGATYSKDNVDYQWRGLLIDEGGFKQSLLAEYVYYYYFIDKIDRLTGMGVTMGKSKNSINVSPNRKMVGVWNSFLAKYQDCTTEQNATHYYKDGVLVIDWLGGKKVSSNVSMIEYLKHNDVDYDGADLTTFDEMNFFGI